MSTGKQIDVAKGGIASHPKYYGSKVLPGMKLPDDTRLFRDVKLREVPSWFLKQDLSLVGAWYSFKRFRERCMTKYFRVRRIPGVFIAQSVAVFAVVCYCGRHDFYKRTEQRRKYH